MPITMTFDFDAPGYLVGGHRGAKHAVPRNLNGRPIE